MKLSEQIAKLSVLPLNKQVVEKIEKEYQTTLPDEIQKIVSLHEHTISYDDFSLLRGLSVDEINDAPSDMATDFIGKKLLPLFDIGDNDYIVFDLAENCWYKYNIADDLKFSKAINLTEYL